MNKLLGFIAIMLTFQGFTQESKHILYLNGHAHLGTGKGIEKSAIAVKDGKFTLVANALLIKIDSSKYDSIVYLKGRHVYPGFIAPNSTVGLTEIDAVRASLDFLEVGNYKPHVRSLIAYNTDSEITPTVRFNGILLGQITPRGGAITGTSSIVSYSGDNWEDAVVKKDDGIHVNWPRMYKRSWSSQSNNKKDDKYGSKVETLKTFFKEAKSYHQLKNTDEKDLRFEAMKPVFEGEKTVFVNADYIKEIIEIVHFKKQLKIEKLVIVGGYDAWMIPEVLKDNNISIMLKRLHSLPAREEDDVDLPYKLPKLLDDLGIPFCLENSGDMEAMGTRNLPFYAGTAVAYGLDYEKAVASITLSTAKILGIDKRVGSIEKGKEATFIISKGDALDMRSNHIENAFVKGVSIDLSNRQLDLYKKYMDKYDLEVR